jgi:hypothetical protein
MREVMIVTAAACLAAGPALAEDSVGHASKAANASVAAVANLAAAGVEAVGGSVALPLALAGGLSEAVGETLTAVGTDARTGGEQLLRDSWGPLAVDERVIVRADPAPKVPYAAQRPARR